NPSALDKYEVGQPVPVRWQAAGLTQVQPALLVNAGGAAVGGWLANSYQPAGSSTSSFSNSVNLSAAADPAPATVYQSFVYNNSYSVGSRIGWQLPVANGNYTIRLHFAEPWTTTVGHRKFDIQLQGTTVRTDFDIYATAGARYKATTLSYPVTATGGTGIALDLVNKTSTFALLCGIEILTPNSTGTASLTADLEFSSDGGSTWSNVATGVAMDRYGAGAFTWTPTVETSQGLLRVRANHGTQPLGLSSGLFQVSNAGTHYYINDAATTGDLLTTAAGNNANTGKSPAEPMSSLAALVAAYDLDPNDIIHVETGDYRLVRNVVLGAGDTGVRIEGPQTGTATLNRGNTATGSYVIELAGADDVSVSRLTLTGAQFGVYAGSTADSDRFTLENSTLTGNTLGGVYLASTNDQPTLSQNRVVGGSRDAIFTEGADALIVGNNVSQSGSGYAGIYASGIRTRIRGNEVYNAYNAMYVNGIAPSTLTDRLEVTGNLVHHNSYSGIYGRYRTLISGNTVWGQTASGGRGIQVENGATAQENEVFDNTLGINLYDSGTVQGNRVYRNSTTGIRMSQGGSVIGNTVYSNSIGIEASDYGSHVVTNNLVYANTNQGIRVAVSNTQVVNNTVYQPVGNAVLVENSVSNITL
ncbi:MAG: right-handed parallel beta-helix repeat-containing protein, partial [Planctomycetaceae bacterium]